MHFWAIKIVVVGVVFGQTFSPYCNPPPPSPQVTSLYKIEIEINFRFGFKRKLKLKLKTDTSLYSNEFYNI